MLRKRIKQFRFMKSPRVFARSVFSDLKMRMGAPTLRSIEFAVTWRCNKNCEYCYALDLMKKNNKDIPVDVIRGVMKQARKLGMVHVNITGGEPLLRSDLAEVVRAIPRDVVVSVVTNNTFLTKEKIDELKKAGVCSLQMSYGSNYVKDFKEELVRYAQEIGIVVCLSVTNVKEEKLYLEDAIKIAEKNNCFVLYNYPMKYCLDGETYWKHRDNPCVREDNLFWAGENRCPAGVEKIYVTNDGDVMICDRIHDVYGNIYSEPLEKIWKRMVECFNIRKRSFCLLDYSEKCKDNPNCVKLNWNAIKEAGLPYKQIT